MHCVSFNTDMKKNDRRTPALYFKSVIIRADQQPFVSLFWFLAFCDIEFMFHSLFVKEDSDDNADDEDHSQNRSNHPD